MLMETADRTQPAEVEAKTERRRRTRSRRERSKCGNWIDQREELKHEPDGQRSSTDPDARSMETLAKGSGLVGYNVQAAVDAVHHLIVAHEVTNEGNDRAQLSNMAQAAREAMGKTKLQALADRGYFNGKELKTCEEAGITTYVPKPMITPNAKAEGISTRATSSISRKDDDQYLRGAAIKQVQNVGEERQRDARLLDQRLPQVPDQRPVHDERLQTNPTMGT